MGSYIIKPMPDDDFYVDYCDGTNTLRDGGTRDSLLDSGYGADRLDRADTRGTSSWPGFQSFDSRNPKGLVHFKFGAVDGAYVIPWEDVHALVDLVKLAYRLLPEADEHQAEAVSSVFRTLGTPYDPEEYYS